MSQGISVKIPLRYDDADGPYQLTKTMPEAVKQNLKHLVLTVPGERVMNPNFGVGIHQLLFENEDDNIQMVLSERLQEQVNRYMPFIDIINLRTDFEEHTLHVEIKYFISPLGISDALSVNVES
jgi:phage baseplate assembly protein W